jgi:hypothetical protein
VPEAPGIEVALYATLRGGTVVAGVIVRVEIVTVPVNPWGVTVSVDEPL